MCAIAIIVTNIAHIFLLFVYQQRYPIELKVLSVLRVLGRYPTFDCVSEATTIGEQTVTT
jgi:hypothetical protein